MADAVPRWWRSDAITGVVGIALAMTATISLIAVLSSLRVEAAPDAEPADLALFDSTRGQWHLRYGDGSVESFYFGIPGDVPLLGDWNCDGVDSVALFRPSSGFVYLSNRNSFGFAESDFFYGNGGDVPIAGDWDGDGCDTLGVQRGGQFFLTNSLGTVPASSQFYYGLPSDVPFAGDFDGDGKDSIGLHRTSRGFVYLSNVNLDGQVPVTAQSFFFGLQQDDMLADDWDGDGDDSVGVYRESEHRFHLAFENDQSFSDLQVDFGEDDWVPLSGYFGSTETSATLIGAGDIAVCGTDFDAATAALLDDRPGTVFTAGDNVYTDGTAAEFADCFDPTWGRHLDRMRPSAGNHDYHTPGATGYFDYFGPRAGTPGEGWYSYDLAQWHVIVLNSNCDEVGGCDSGSPQHDWLEADLAAHPAACTLAYWHHPLFDAGFHPDSSEVLPFWETLYAAGADVVLNGHDHNYQRWARQDPTGLADPLGIRQFIVGTGGVFVYPLTATPLTLEVSDTSHGVLELQLNPGGYSWEFLAVPGSTFTDSGSEACS